MVALVKILAVFLAVVLLLRTRLSITWLIAGGAIALGFLFHVDARAIAGVFGRSLSDGKTLELVAVLYLIALLEAVLRHSGWLKRLTESFLGLVRRPVWSASLLPALLGLLPSAGGARFSAPLVASVLEDQSVEARDKVVANYWFRHLWEMVLPLYPGLIVAAVVSGFTLKDFVLCQWHYPFILFFSGWLNVWMGKKLPRSGGRRGGVGRLLALTWPVILPVAAVLLLARVQLVLLAAMSVTVGAVILYLRLSGRELARLSWEAFKPSIILVVAAVMIFKNMLEETHSIIDVNQFLQARGVPLAVIFFALPFLVGLLTGVTQAYVGITFPLLAPLAASTGAPLPYYSFAYMAGFIGVMLSPTHLCLILTAEYFKTRLGQVYPRLIRTALLPLAVIILSLLLTM